MTVMTVHDIVPRSNAATEDTEVHLHVPEKKWTWTSGIPYKSAGPPFWSQVHFFFRTRLGPLPENGPVQKSGPTTWSNLVRQKQEFLGEFLFLRNVEVDLSRLLFIWSSSMLMASVNSALPAKVVEDTQASQNSSGGQFVSPW